MSHQRIRIATILSDLLLINGGFALAYVIRYRWQWLRPVARRVARWRAAGGRANAGLFWQRADQFWRPIISR